MADEPVTRVDHDHIAVLGLNRPEKLNAFDDSLRHRLVERIAECVADDEVRVIVVHGHGRSFSVGADASGAGHTDLTPEEWRVMLLEEGWGQFLALWESPKPVLVQVHGHCLGIAVVLCNLADVVVVAEDARVGWPALPFGGGLIGPSMVWHLGIHRAKEYSFQIGSTLTGVEAASYGFANRAVPADDLADHVLAMAMRMARIPSDLLRVKKEAINNVFDSLGFTTTMRASAAWATLAHGSRGAEDAKALLRDVGLRAAIDHYRS